jgi:hypothetical protein
MRLRKLDICVQKKETRLYTKYHLKIPLRQMQYLNIKIKRVKPLGKVLWYLSGKLIFNMISKLQATKMKREK